MHHRSHGQDSIICSLLHLFKLLRDLLHLRRIVIIDMLYLLDGWLLDSAYAALWRLFSVNYVDHWRDCVDIARLRLGVFGFAQHL